MAPVLLKRWSPLFDPEREQIGAGPLWVRLPGLPLQYWCEEAFIRIGNALGTYLDHDRTLVESSDRTVARILVHLDTPKGLVGKITLLWGNYTRVQITTPGFRYWITREFLFDVGNATRLGTYSRIAISTRR